MSREKSQFLSGFGVAFEIFKRIADAVLEQGGSDGDLRRVLSEEGLASGVAKLIVSSVRQSFKVLVDCTKSLAEMIQAGSYGYVNSDINSKNFRVEGQGQQKVEVVLFHFKRAISIDDALREMEKAGYRPARIEELLALGAQYPDLQKQFPIVALGSMWQNPNGYCGVAFLGRVDAERKLSSDWIESDWSGGCRFVAVRK
jgi:hypothetical protein